MNRTLMWMVMGIFLLTGLTLGGYDPSGNISAQNLSEDNISALGLENDIDNATLSELAPQTAATNPGEDQAVYVEEAPSQDSLGTLVPIDLGESSLKQIYYSGNYMALGSFRSMFPSNFAGLWIAGSDGWSWYATMPLGSWAQELIYVPLASSVSIYEVYPGGYAQRYNLGYFQPGFYYIWYYADSPGRHFSQFSIGGRYSNAVVVDVYSLPVRSAPVQPKPSPKDQCEANPLCYWDNGQCNCNPAPNPVAECEDKGCEWYDGQCICNPAPNPVAECEDKGCQWYDGDCHCDIPGPVPNPVAECEKNPTCNWADGQCLCTGDDPDGPMPGPVPNPTPDPEPDPNPAPNPVAECEEKPGCHWADGQCVCAGDGSDGGYSSSD